MIRMLGVTAAVTAAMLCVSCSKAEPIEIPVPEGVNLPAAAEVRDEGNGLWLLEGPTAASHVIDAMRDAGGGTMTASVLEMVPVDQGDPIVGRSIAVTSSSDGVNWAASVTVGDQTGEVVMVDDTVWLRGNERFAESAMLPSLVTAELAADSETFVCLERNLVGLTPFETLADPVEFLRTTLTGSEVATPLVSLGDAETQTLTLGSGGAPTGELVVNLRGAPLPQRLFISDESGTVQAQFTWGDIDEISQPSHDSAGCA